MSKDDIGRGYNGFTADLAGTPFDIATLPAAIPTTPPGGQRTAFFAKLVEDSASIATTLDLSAQASFSVGAFQGKVSADFSRVTNRNAYSLFVVGKVEVEFEKVTWTARDFANLRF